MEVKHCRPHLPVLCIFGVTGAIGISLGVGAFVTFMGLGIVDSVNHKGTELMSYMHLLTTIIYFICFSDLPLPRTHYIAAVWAFGNFKWGLTAFLYALKTFRKMFRSQFQPLREQLEDECPDEETSRENINTEQS